MHTESREVRNGFWRLLRVFWPDDASASVEGVAELRIPYPDRARARKTCLAEAILYVGQTGV